MDKNYLAIQFYSWYICIHNPFRIKARHSYQEIHTSHVFTKIGFISVIYDGAVK